MSEQMTFGRALNRGLHRALADDPKVLLMGEDIGRLSGVFRITDGLQEEFGVDRVVDTPLAEAGTAGTAIGLTLRGYRPVVEIQFDGFLYPAFDQIVANLAKLRARTRGRVAVPVTIRIPYGGGIGSPEHHCESPEAYFLHAPGLRVVSPSSPQAGYEMIRAAIASDDPVVFLEPKRRYHDKGPVDLDAAPGPLSVGRVLRPGAGVTLVAYGPLVKTALQAAEVAVPRGRGCDAPTARDDVGARLSGRTRNACAGPRLRRRGAPGRAPRRPPRGRWRTPSPGRPRGSRAG